MPARHTRKPKLNSATPEEEIRWVMSVMSTDWLDQLSEADAPSAEAWALLVEYGSDADSRRAFMEKYYNKLVGKKETEQDTSLIDDQRKFFRLFELLELERPELIDGNDNFPRTVVVEPADTVAGGATVSSDCTPESAVIGPEGTQAVSTANAAAATA